MNYGTQISQIGCPRAESHPNGHTGIGDDLAATKTVGLLHRDGADSIVAHVLRYFKHQPSLKVRHL